MKTPFVTSNINHLNSWTCAPGFRPCPSCFAVGSLKDDAGDAVLCDTCHGSGRVAVERDPMQAAKEYLEREPRNDAPVIPRIGATVTLPAMPDWFTGGSK